MKKGTVILLLLAQIMNQSVIAEAGPVQVDTTGLPPDGGQRYNRLVFEKSPYLLLHAANPIDWYPWSEEAFERARRENKPVFLSIGYSTCHWCHVMAREAFSSEEVAAILNEHYISIKVDREERPDIDQIYMTVSQIMTGRGGWPLTIIMTPEKKPFFAGTYIPLKAASGRGGLVELLERVMEIWDSTPEKIIESADTITAALAVAGRHEGGDVPETAIFREAYEAIEERFDAEHGGFGTAPKFPRAHMLQFLLRYGKRTGTRRPADMVEETLRALRRGGIFDQLGYGFHRYSTDREFLVPHFEKMLYDQALLALAYLEAYQATGKKEFAETAREIFAYVLRDMTSPEGGFFSAQDADSEGVEGKFYLWTEKEILDVLGSRDGAIFAKTFNVTKDGNYRDEASGKLTGMNILHLKRDPPRRTRAVNGRALLFRHRLHRVPPLTDDKVLTAWNGLMIAALAKGGAVLGDESFTAAAVKASRFILTALQDEKGRLLRRFRAGESSLNGYLNDYAFFVFALTELYESTYEPVYLKEAVRLNTEMVRLFWDDREGGFTFSGKGSERLLTTIKETYDGALPSGNSVALLNLLRLARLTGDQGLEDRARRLAQAFAGDIVRSPQGHTMMLTALDFLHGPTKEIVVVGKPEAKETKAMLAAIAGEFLPNVVVVLRPPGERGAKVAELAPYVEYMKMRRGRPTAYVCENFTCKEPVTDLKKLKKMLP